MDRYEPMSQKSQVRTRDSAEWEIDCCFPLARHVGGR